MKKESGEMKCLHGANDAAYWPSDSCMTTAIDQVGILSNYIKCIHVSTILTGLLWYTVTLLKCYQNILCVRCGVSGVGLNGVLNILFSGIYPSCR